MSGRAGGGRSIAWLGVASAALVLGLQTTGASALSLADLVEEESFSTAAGVTYEHFDVRVKGRLSRDLEDYQVVLTRDGFALFGYVSAGRGRRAGQGRIRLSYEVSSDEIGGLLGSSVLIDPGDDALSVRKQLRDGRRRLAKLLASTDGELSDQVELAGLDALQVRETIRLHSGFAGGLVASQFQVVPEPATGALLGLGLAAAAWRRRRSAWNH